MLRASGEEWNPAGAASLGASLKPTFDEVYEAWFDEVGRWVRALGGPPADRDDLVQDVFVIVHRRLPHFDGANLAGWLYQITRHRVRDFRRLAWFKHLFFRDGRTLDMTNSGAPDREGELESREQRRLLEALLMTLPAHQRAAFVLFEIEGRSGDEIALLQSVPLNTVWARIHSARKKLSARLGRLEGEKRKG